MTALRSTTRGISPVIGGVLLLAIVLLLSAIVAGMLFDLTGETDPAPEISFALEETDDSPFERWIVHEQGEQLDGDAVEIRGIADADGLSGSTLLASERHRVLPTDETIRIVWSGESGTSYTLREFSVDPERTAPEPDVACDWVDSESNGGVRLYRLDDSRTTLCRVHAKIAHGILNARGRVVEREGVVYP